MRLLQVQYTNILEHKFTLIVSGIDDNYKTTQITLNNLDDENNNNRTHYDNYT